MRNYKRVFNLGALCDNLDGRDGVQGVEGGSRWKGDIHTPLADS